MQLTEKEFIETLKQNQGIIFKVANSYTSSIEERDDLIQEISIQMWRAWPKFDKKFKISTWMYRIALNVAISFYRKHVSRKKRYVVVSDEVFIMDESNDAELSDNLKALRHYISQLNEFNRALILLYLENYSYEEIADALGISLTNVSTKISRIKRELKEKFKNIS